MSSADTAPLPVGEDVRRSLSAREVTEKYVKAGPFERSEFLRFLLSEACALDAPQPVRNDGLHALRGQIPLGAYDYIELEFQFEPRTPDAFTGSASRRQHLVACAIGATDGSDRISVRLNTLPQTWASYVAAASRHVTTRMNRWAQAGVFGINARNTIYDS